MYDAIIVGGRCAGAATAIFLAQRGHSVLLIDRDDHPSHTLSTHTFGDLELFERLGVLAAIADAAPHIRRFRNDLAGTVLESDLVVTPWASGIRREKLDPILIERACEFPNITWLPRTTVTDLVEEDGRIVGVTARPRDGELFEARARVVIGADGRYSYVARRVNAQEYDSAPEIRCAYYAYYAGLQPLPVPTFEFYWKGTDVAQVQPCDDGLHCVCLMPLQAEFDDWRQAPEASYEERLTKFQNLVPRLAGATRVSPVRGSGTLRSFIRQPYGPGWALAGDAGICTHPVHGAGIDAAVFSAEILAKALDRYFREEASWEEAMSEYQQQRDQRMKGSFDYAVKVAQLPPLPDMNLGLLGVLCNMTNLGYLLGEKIETVLALLRSEKAVEGMKAMVIAARAFDRPEREPALK